MSASMSHAPLFKVVLQKVAAIVHRLSSLDLEVDAMRELVDFSEDLLEFFAAKQVVELPAADGNQEEDVPHDDGELLKEVTEAVKIVRVVAADGGVHLDGNARFVGPFDCLDGKRIGAGQPAEGVVNFRG